MVSELTPADHLPGRSGLDPLGGSMAHPVDNIHHTIVVCSGSDCRKKGARELKHAARKALKKLGRAENSLVVSAECCGLCKQAPVACVDGSDWMGRVKPKALKREIARAALHRDHEVA